MVDGGTNGVEVQDEAEVLMFFFRKLILLYACCFGFMCIVFYLFFFARAYVPVKRDLSTKRICS